MSVNNIMISMAGNIGKVFKCKDSFVCVCPEKDISSIEEKRWCNKIGD